MAWDEQFFGEDYMRKELQVREGLRAKPLGSAEHP
jgi:hypothetical protein